MSTYNIYFCREIRKMFICNFVYLIWRLLQLHDKTTLIAYVLVLELYQKGNDICVMPHEKWEVLILEFSSFQYHTQTNGQVNPCPAEPGYTLLYKQCRSWSVGFWRSQLIWICTVCHSVSDFISITWIKYSRLSLSRTSRDLIKMFELSVVRDNQTVTS